MSGWILGSLIGVCAAGIVAIAILVITRQPARRDFDGNDYSDFGPGAQK